MCRFLGCRLAFILSALVVFEELVNSNNSTRGVYFELLLEDSAKGLCYVNIYPSSIFPCSLLFWLFPLPPSLSRRLTIRTAALRTASGSNAWLLWEGKYLAIF